MLYILIAALILSLLGILSLLLRIRNLDYAINDLAEVSLAQESDLLQQREIIEGIVTELEQTQFAIDMLASEQPKEKVKPTTRPQSIPEEVSVNQQELNDHLPLQGHTIIVGQSGSGKSNLVMSRIIRCLKAEQVIHAIDTKDELGPIFGRHIDVVGTDKAVAKFRELLALAKERRECFSQISAEHEQPCRDYGEYFELTGEKMPIVQLIVEELVVVSQHVDQELLIELLVTGRSAGVFVTCLSQYLKADILDRKGSINFGTRVFMGKYDKVACGILFGTMERADIQQLQEFVGAPGKAAVDELGNMKFVTMPRITNDYLIPFMRRTK